MEGLPPHTSWGDGGGVSRDVSENPESAVQREDPEGGFQSEYLRQPPGVMRQLAASKYTVETRCRKTLSTSAGCGPKGLS